MKSHKDQTGECLQVICNHHGRRQTEAAELSAVAKVLLMYFFQTFLGPPKSWFFPMFQNRFIRLDSFDSSKLPTLTWEEEKTLLTKQTKKANQTLDCNELKCTF